MNQVRSSTHRPRAVSGIGSAYSIPILCQWGDITLQVYGSVFCVFFETSEGLPATTFKGPQVNRVDLSLLIPPGMPILDPK